MFKNKKSLKYNKVIATVLSTTLMLCTVTPSVASAKEKTDEKNTSQEQIISNADFSKLQQIINLSEQDIQNINISTDGTDIPQTQYWVTQTVYNNFNAEINKSNNMIIEKKAAQTEVDKQVGVLTNTKNIFDKSKTQGRKIEPQPTPQPTPTPTPTPTQEPEYSNIINDVIPNYNYSTDLVTDTFIATIAEPARIIAQENDLYPSVMIAQAILESGSGMSELAKAPNNNLFGIKGAWTDENNNKQTVTMKTKEDDGTGNTYTINSEFRKYNNHNDSLKDYAKLLTDINEGEGLLYKNTHKTNAKTYQDACKALQGTYATDTDYANKLINIIKTYNLDNYDKEINYKITGTIYDPLDKNADKYGYRNLTMDDYANLITTTVSQLGKDYVWGGEDPETGFDCSGLCHYAYQEALGTDITRTTYTQETQGTNIPFENLRAGDLLFFQKNNDTYHVAMYLENGFYIQAPQPGDKIKITSMNEYEPTFAKRLIKFQENTNLKDTTINETVKTSIQKTLSETFND